MIAVYFNNKSINVPCKLTHNNGSLEILKMYDFRNIFSFTMYYIWNIWPSLFIESTDSMIVCEKYNN